MLSSIELLWYRFGHLSQLWPNLRDLIAARKFYVDLFTDLFNPVNAD